jgi:hypothetical protein
VTLLNPLPLLFASALLAIGCSAESGRILPSVEIDSGEPDLGLGTGGTPDEGTGGMGTGGMIDPGTGGVIDPGTGGTGMGGAPMDVAPDLPVSQDLPSEEAPPPASFTCNHVMGGFVLGQWYPSFESKMDTTHWQALSPTGASIEIWAMANSGLWSTGITSPCAAGLRPDRVLLIVYSSMLTTQTQFENSIKATVANIKLKYFGVKHIELLSTLRTPDNKLCNNNNASLTIVPAYVDQAIQAVADQSLPAGMVTVGPKIAVPSCSSWDTTLGPSSDLTPTSAPAVGQLYVDYYKDHL